MQNPLERNKKHMITGLNHITLSAKNLSKSISFYTDILGFTLKAKWKKGAYLTFGEMWLCLTLQPKSSNSTTCADADKDYTHIAFDVNAENFTDVVNKIKASTPYLGHIKCWQKNHSEGNSYYFLDQSNHKLEIHVGNLQTRLESLKQLPYEGLELFD